jgi:hypothetical protein
MKHSTNFCADGNTNKQLYGATNVKPAYIPNVHGQITEMKHSDSNNCIAVTRPMNNILQTDSSHQNISTNNFMEQQIQNPAYIPNVQSHDRNEA